MQSSVYQAKPHSFYSCPSENPEDCRGSRLSRGEDLQRGEKRRECFENRTDVCWDRFGKTEALLEDDISAYLKGFKGLCIFKKRSRVVWVITQGLLT